MDCTNAVQNLRVANVIIWANMLLSVSCDNQYDDKSHVNCFVL